MKLRRLDFSLLLVFQALLRHRRATAAALELGLSASAISHALARLRRLFGDPLFKRLPHGMEPTRHALALAGRIDALLRDGRETLGQTSLFSPATTRRDFRIAAPDHLGAILAAPLLRCFRKDAPNSRFGLGISLGDDALEDLRKDRIDLALGQFQGGISGYHSAPLYDDRYVLVARRGRPDLKTKVSAKTFERLEHIAISVAGDFRVLTDAQFRQIGLSRRIVATVPRFSTAFETVSRSDAVAVAPERFARAQADVFRLSIHALPKPLPTIHIVSVRRRTQDPGIEWLATSIEACLR